MRALTIAVVLSFAVLGCKKDAPKEPEATAVDSERADEAEPAAREEDEKPVAVTKDMVGKFVGYQKEMLALSRAQLEELAKVSQEAGKKDSLGASMDAVNKIGKMQETHEKNLVELQKKSGLSQREIDQVQAIVGDTVLIRGMAKQNQGAIQKSIDEARKNLAEEKNVAPERRKAVEDYIAQMEGSIKSMLDVTDARKKYGDAAVDAVLAHEDAIYANQLDALKAAAKK